MSLLVCFSVLGGLVVGLRFNVRMLVWLCMAALVAGIAGSFGGFVGPGRGVLMTTVSIVALQVGYFVALVIGAMRLTEEPVFEEVEARDTRAEISRPRRA